MSLAQVLPVPQGPSTFLTHEGIWNMTICTMLVKTFLTHKVCIATVLTPRATLDPQGVSPWFD